MIVDANLLLYARHSGAREHERARDWLTEALNGPQRVGLPWESLSAFARVASQPRLALHPLAPAEVAAQIAEWLAAPAAWVPVPTERHAEVLCRLIEAEDIRGNLVPDAHLAALAICHGVPVCSADTDFARFGELRWINPLS